MQLLVTNDPHTRAESFHLPSERFNTRASHIQCCPFNLGNSVAVTDRLPSNGLEARLLPGMSILFIGLTLWRRQSVFVVSGPDRNDGSGHQNGHQTS